MIQDPERSDAVYIFAVNHLGNPDFDPVSNSKLPAARSQVEIFHHALATSTVRHVRSVRHPLVKTPNDLHATSPYSFYVTNDHCYQSGFLRHVEEFIPWLQWTDVVHVQLDRSSLTSSDGTAGIEASVALDSMAAANGMGHGASDEVLVTSVLRGILRRARVDENGRTLSVQEDIWLDSVIDNPSYYEDPYKTADDDASGYVLAGLRRGIDLPKTHKDPEGTDGAIVWFARRNKDSTGWEKRVIFEDDGSNIRSASAAVLVPIEPVEGSTKQAMLFVTGFVSSGAVAVRVNL